MSDQRAKSQQKRAEGSFPGSTTAQTAAERGVDGTGQPKQEEKRILLKRPDTGRIFFGFQTPTQTHTTRCANTTTAIEWFFSLG